MSELMADDVQALGRLGKQLAVTVAEEHVTSAVPERVVVAGAVVDEALDGHALVVDRVAPEDLPVQVIGVAEVVVGLVDRVVGYRRVAVAAGKRPWRLRGRVLLVEDLAARRPPRAGNAGQRLQ